MEIPLLEEIIIVFGLSIAVILACYRLKLPSIVGFLLTGMLSGPQGLGLINALEDVDRLATIGIIFLLFTVGMEFSLSKIREYKRYFLIGGSLQVSLTILLGVAVTTAFGKSFGESLFLGFLLSLSSTAITLRILEERSEIETPHGSLTTGILIFQDLIAIPMLLFTPILAGKEIRFDPQFWITIFMGIGTLFFVLLAAAKIVPSLLYYIAKTRSRELFLLSILTICFSVAWLTSSIGLSLSLGAFLAGLIISDSEYRHEAVSHVLPLRDVFTSFFFISVGMLLDVSFVLKQPVLILILTAGVLILKTFTASLAAIALGLSLRTALLTGIALSQIGEFSFVIAKNGTLYGIADEYHYQLFLAVSLITMGLTPILISQSEAMAHFLLKLPFLKNMGFNEQNKRSQPTYKNHILIVGFGMNGRNVARSAKEAGLPYIVLDMNPQTVKVEKKQGEPIFFGDATHSTILQHIHIEQAQAIVIVVNDFNASCRIVELARQLNPWIYIVVRTRYFLKIPTLCALGANDVIPDEFGSSIEILNRVLNIFRVPFEKIETITENIRQDTYEKIKDYYHSPTGLRNILFSPDPLEVGSFQANSFCPLLGKPLSELDLRKKYGVNILAIKRNDKTIIDIDAKTQIIADDIVTLTGTSANLKNMNDLFNVNVK